MTSDVGVRSILGRGGDFSDELGEEIMRMSSDRDLFRSGSAPPTVQGSLKAVGSGSLLCKGREEEEELRTDPAYGSFYYQIGNKVNPRLPETLLCNEVDWGFAQRVDVDGGFGEGIGDRKGNKVQPYLGNAGWKNAGDTVQPSCRNTFNENGSISHMHQGLTSMEYYETSGGTQTSHRYASALGASPLINIEADSLLSRAPSPQIPQAGSGRINSMDERYLKAGNSHIGISSGLSESEDIVTALTGLNISNSIADRRDNYLLRMPCESDEPQNLYRNYGIIKPRSPNIEGNPLGRGILPPLYENATSAALFGGFSLGPNMMAAAAAAELRSHRMDHLDCKRLLTNELNDAHMFYLNDPAMCGSCLGSSYTDVLELQKAYLADLLVSQKSPYSAPYIGKYVGVDDGYCGNPGFGFGSVFSAGYGSPTRHGECLARFSPSSQNFAGRLMGAWHPDGGSFTGGFGSTLLDEFKSNKTRCFALSEVAGHIVEFSSDQYGSRFIQQKLETASVEEKEIVFLEIMPEALTLMTDVFGNYVVQKFFEHGSAVQNGELADQLTGNVLALSLQMYGCRVIQKAIEVVDLDQKKKLVSELDGHVMRCVLDQNGNHVIQKCIECVPENAINFIISTFYDQVVTLSTHAYGCRVIQRILEHCHDPKTLSIMMDEILNSVCVLAQDQYGNYVIQYVLEHGKSHERSYIISQLSGQIVRMSQQKFSSNVVEKCLMFGDSVERQTLVNEMLGSTDENESLQIMVKDQFANYVVQKVIETCDYHQLELILNRLKAHLTKPKKYTYGKHIVARLEKLVAAGEKRISSAASQNGR